MEEKMIRGFYLEFPPNLDTKIQILMDQAMRNLVEKGLIKGYYVAPPENSERFPSLLCLEAECEGK